MTATCHAFSLEEYCSAVRDEIARLVSIAEGVDGATPIPTCPDWDMAALLVHIGGVHRWAGGQVEVLTPERIPSAKLGITIPDDVNAFPEWLAEGGEQMLKILSSADPDATMWAWGSDKHARFWPRRMLHETTVHRADAEIALGRQPSIDAAIAEDGIDEFLDNLPHAAYFAPNVEQLRGDGSTLRFTADTGTSWRITLKPDRFEWDHENGDAASTVEGTAAGLLLFAYGRRKPGSDGISARGDNKLLEHWIANSSI